MVAGDGDKTIDRHQEFDDRQVLMAPVAEVSKSMKSVASGGERCLGQHILKLLQAAVDVADGESASTCHRSAPEQMLDLELPYEGDDLAGAREAEFLKQRPYLGLHRHRLDAAALGDLANLQALQEACDKLPLCAGEAAEMMDEVQKALLAGPEPAVFVHDQTLYASIEVRLTVQDRGQTVLKSGPGGILDDEILCPACHRRDDSALLVMARQIDDLRIGVSGQDAACRLYASIRALHLYVHEDDVDRSPVERLDRLLSGGDTRDDLETSCPSEQIF